MSETFGSSVEIKPGEVKNLELSLPIISTPESYLVKIVLLDENFVQVSNQYSFRYVTSGISNNLHTSPKSAGVVLDFLSSFNIGTKLLFAIIFS